MNWTRMQLAVGTSVVTFLTLVLLQFLHGLLGDIVAYIGASALAAGLLVWFIDYTSERWTRPRDE